MKHILLIFVVLLGFFSFLFNFIWEWFQCAPFFIHRGTQALPLSMVSAALGDVLLTFLILIVVYISKYRSLKLLHECIAVKNFFYLEFVSFLFAISVEKVALAKNRWSYTYSNPVIPIFGVSVLPVLQIMLITPSVLYITIIILRKIKSFIY